MSATLAGSTQTYAGQPIHTLLESIQQGKAVADINITNDTITPGYLYQLSFFRHGTNTPARWNIPVVGVLKHNETITATFSTRDARNGDHTETITLNRDTVNNHVTLTPYRNRRQLARLAGTLRDESWAAQWGLIEMWRPFLIDMTVIVSRKVATELSNGKNRDAVVDRTEAEAITDEYLLGDEHGRHGLFQTHVLRATSPETLHTGDRVAYIKTHAHNALDAAIRRRLGDPSQGRAIRRIIREQGGQINVENIREEHSRRYPKRAKASNKVIAKAVAATELTRVMNVDSEELLDLLSHNTSIEYPVGV